MKETNYVVRQEHVATVLTRSYPSKSSETAGPMSVSWVEFRSAEVWTWTVLCRYCAARHKGELSVLARFLVSQAPSAVPVYSGTSEQSRSRSKVPAGSHVRPGQLENASPTAAEPAIAWHSRPVKSSSAGRFHSEKDAVAAPDGTSPARYTAFADDTINHGRRRIESPLGTPDPRSSTWERYANPCPLAAPRLKPFSFWKIRYVSNG
ncbi:hypothetical protein C8034_v008231 [Colletotrichum sidae]|uniref:Uncharacterized protein n=1 Tax=Colletotrichum sidae TaxID=1347389 RepID=A0A4R8TPN7_9PEZI|nr:hypothetical protein C8034_v008231 [Colletotrichum sidae]